MNMTHGNEQNDKQQRTEGQRDSDKAVTSQAASIGQKWHARYVAARARLDDTAALCDLYVRLHNLQAVDHVSVDALYAGERFARPESVALITGSFNPLTTAHVALAEAALREGGFDMIVWGIATSTIDKEMVERASLEDRFTQLIAFSHVFPDGAVVAFNKGLYVDEARALRQVLPADCTINIVVGFDKIVQILDPRYYSDREVALRELFELASIRVAPRAEFGEAALRELLAQPDNRRYQDMVAYLPLNPVYAAKSSTEVRALARRQETIAEPEEPVKRVLTPEGAALVALGPYEDTAAGTAQDQYMIRLRWIRLLARLAEESRHELPRMGELERATRENAGLAEELTTAAGNAIDTLPEAGIRRLVRLATQRHFNS